MYYKGTPRRERGSSEPLAHYTLMVKGRYLQRLLVLVTQLVVHIQLQSCISVITTVAQPSAIAPQW